MLELPLAPAGFPVETQICLPPIGAHFTGGPEIVLVAPCLLQGPPILSAENDVLVLETEMAKVREVRRRRDFFDVLMDCLPWAWHKYPTPSGELQERAW